MIETAILGALIDRIIALLKRREEVKLAHLEKFIAPSVQNLEALHQEYVVRFSKYRDAVEDTQFALDMKHPVLAMMKKDAIYARAAETKIAELNHLKISVGVASSLFDAMKCYLLSNTVPTFAPLDIDIRIYELGGLPNARTRQVPEALSIVLSDSIELNDEGRRQLMIEVLDAMVVELQERYSVVIAEYYKVKEQLGWPS